MNLGTRAKFGFKGEKHLIWRPHYGALGDSPGIRAPRGAGANFLSTFREAADIYIWGTILWGDRSSYPKILGRAVMREKKPSPRKSAKGGSLKRGVILREARFTGGKKGGIF